MSIKTALVGLHQPKVADQLLHERELKGMRIHVYFKIGLLVYMLVVDALLPQQGQVNWGLGLLYLLLLGIEGLFLRWLNCNKNLHLIAFSSLGVDILLITLLPFGWLNSAGGLDQVSPVYLLKSSMPLVADGLIIINALTLRPLYPLLMSTGAFGVALFLYLFALADPRTQISYDLAESSLGPSINPALYWINSFTFFLFGIGSAYIAYAFRKTVQEAVLLEKSNLQLGRYFSPNLVAAIAQGSESFLQPGGKRQPVAIMFVDIRGFTRMSEQLPPEEVVSFLSHYHEKMVGIIFAHGGTLDKFMGDGILATFGTPEPNEDDLIHALQAGIAMKHALKDLNQERLAQGKPQIGQGIGIHYGEVIAGNIGTKERLEYTVIGDAVN